MVPGSLSPRLAGRGRVLTGGRAEGASRHPTRTGGSSAHLLGQKPASQHQTQQMEAAERGCVSASPALLRAYTIEPPLLYAHLPATDPGSRAALSDGIQEPVPDPELQLFQVSDTNLPSALGDHDLHAAGWPSLPNWLPVNEIRARGPSSPQGGWGANISRAAACRTASQLPWEGGERGSASSAPGHDP